jgi:hypothetical protein
MKAMVLIMILLSFFFIDEQAPEKSRIKLGTFDGRTPCVELAKLLEEKPSSACIKIKWRLILYVDSLSKEPRGYELTGFVYKRSDPRTGTWKITKGTPDEPNAVIYELHSDNKPTIYLRRDDDILFFLSDKKKYLVGNYDFSFALNKIN